MKVLYLDCFSGISGDMMVGALVDAGVSMERIETELKKLPFSGYKLQWSKVVKKGIYATKMDVILDDNFEHEHEVHSHHHDSLNSSATHSHRHYAHIVETINQSELHPEVKKRSQQIFHSIAAAESKIHHIPVEKVHFHEVGAIDSIVDIVATAVALEELKIDRIISSPVPVGSGYIHCAHGTYPVPSPATLEILRNVPIKTSNLPFELTTPTGAGIVKSQVASFGPIPAMTISSVGYGAGTRDLPNQPNVLRVVVGEMVNHLLECEPLLPLQQQEVIYILECHVDDMSGEVLGYVMEGLFQMGAVDVFYTPIFMKKNRPGVLLTVLASANSVEECEQFILIETTTLGVRKNVCTRSILGRKSVSVSTPYGNIRLKQAIQNGKIIRQVPEYEDVKKAATDYKVPFLEAYVAAMEIARERSKGEES
ncbi:nickel pincer cofactor biosynthesis protein LarC [Aeribacillus sp. SP014]